MYMHRNVHMHTRTLDICRYYIHTITAIIIHISQRCQTVAKPSPIPRAWNKHGLIGHLQGALENSIGIDNQLYLHVYIYITWYYQRAGVGVHTEDKMSAVMHRRPRCTPDNYMYMYMYTGNFRCGIGN